MSDTNEMTPSTNEEFEAFLPEGWAEGDDIFDEGSWTGGEGQTDESVGSDGAAPEAEGAGSAGEEVPAIGQTASAEESGETGAEAPAMEQSGKSANKFKFSAQIDHKMQDVELGEDELPTIYQKAHVTDRVRAKLEKAQPLVDKGERLAKMLGFDSADEMLDSAEQNYINGEIEKLTDENVHPEVAKELVYNRVEKARTSTPAAPQEDARDFKAEVSGLLFTHPELRGTQLPDEVVQDCVVNGMSLDRAYEKYSRKQAEAETKALKAENKTLKQNAETARRAPVRGVSKGGAAANAPDDPFLAGFYSDY